MSAYNKGSYLSLSYLFSPSVLHDLFFHNYSDRLVRVFNDCKTLEKIPVNLTLKDFFEDSYKELLDNYRNEYVFKNAIAEKILIGRHSIKSSSLFTEFRVHTSKADVVIFNGTSHVYEIKTELDKLDRLPTQIKNYQKVFDYVNVVSVASKVDAIIEIVDESVGIIVLTDQYTLKTIRKAKSGLKNLEHNDLFDLLRKDEYLKIIKKYNGYIPELPNTKMYAACKSLFQELPIQQIHEQMLILFKERKNHKSLEVFLKNIPRSLKIAILEANLSVKQQSDFLILLNQKISKIFR